MMKLKDQNEDGVLGDEDMVYIGNGDPKVIYGLNNAFRYKNFDLNIYFYGEAGRKRGASYYEGWTRMDNGINVSTYSLNSFSSNTRKNHLRILLACQRKQRIIIVYQLISVIRLGKFAPHLLCFIPLFSHHIEL